MKEFNAEDLFKFNSKVKNCKHGYNLVEKLQEYVAYVQKVGDDEYTIKNAIKDLFILNKDISWHNEDTNCPSIINYYKIDANTLDIYYDCYCGIAEVDSINGDFAYKLIHDDELDKKAIRERFDDINNAHSDYLDSECA